MAYDPLQDVLLEIALNFGSNDLDLVKRSPVTGAVISTQTLGLKTWGWIADKFQIYPLGNRFVLVGPAKDVLGTVLRHTFVIDPVTADIVFASYLVG